MGKLWDTAFGKPFGVAKFNRIQPRFRELIICKPAPLGLPMFAATSQDGFTVGLREHLVFANYNASKRAEALGADTFLLFDIASPPVNIHDAEDTDDSPEER